MANWSNARLLAVGTRHAVSAFSAKARKSPTTIFRGDMLVGEAQGLRAERLERLDADRYRKVYRFQVCDDDGLVYFRRISERHPKLSFILVYGDPNMDAYGSYSLKIGLVKEFRVSRAQNHSVMRKHGVGLEDDDEWRFWEASWELMDVAEAHWASEGGRPNIALQPTRRDTATKKKRTLSRRAARS